ncbi:nitrate reductase cytochrome c-type subunit [Campylobacter majalis]|uniref:nitrate reductase cytochrome c-type subunit n=1 Tax=Campylobacter majalis TaxID=2790656 RepID=UPI003D684F52
MRLKYILPMVLAAFLVSCAMSQKELSDTEIGYRNVDLLDENSVVAKDITWSNEPAGMSKKIERSFENAPPFIPHDIEGLVPITKDMNMCVTCHMPEFAADSGATAIPASHLYDIRNKKDKDGVLHDERFNCDTCHVPLSNAKVPINNNFKADFRQDNGSEKSNLLDVLNDGIK